MKAFLVKHVEKILVIIFSCLACVLITKSRYAIYSGESQAFIKALSDGTFVVGILLFSFGALIYFSTLGAFDAIAYGLYTIGTRITHKKERFEERKTYYEFQLLRHDKTKRRNFLVVVGGFFLIVSIILVILWMKLK